MQVRKGDIRDEKSIIIISGIMHVFGHSGRFSPEKNHNYLIEIYKY